MKRHVLAFNNLIINVPVKQLTLHLHFLARLRVVHLEHFLGRQRFDLLWRLAVHRVLVIWLQESL